MYALRLLLLILGVVACSTAALMIKRSATDPALVAAWRLILACGVLLPVHLVALRRHRGFPRRRLWLRALPAGVLLAIHFWTWNIGVRMTAIGNASLVVNLTPVAMPFIVFVMLRERIRGLEILGTAVALAGTMLLAYGDLQVSRDHFLGDLTCFFSMLFFAVYLAWSRRSGDVPNIWLYVPPVYLVAAIVSLAIGTASAGTPLPVGGREWLLLAGLALVPTITGHTILNHAMQTMRSQVVALVNVGQFISATILAWLILAEAPSSPWLFAVAAPLVAAGCALAILARRRRPGMKAP